MLRGFRPPGPTAGGGRAGGSFSAGGGTVTIQTGGADGNRTSERGFSAIFVLSPLVLPDWPELEFSCFPPKDAPGRIPCFLRKPSIMAKAIPVAKRLPGRLELRIRPAEASWMLAVCPAVVGVGGGGAQRRGASG